MKIVLAETIKMFRKERKLTQAQLAEALGVTIGAVSKWESSLSIPDITLIIEMADLFETSVDVLIGYEWKKGNLGKTIESLKTNRRKKQFDQGLREAEKALLSYPNHFDLVYECAIFYGLYGVEQKSKQALERSLELHQRSLELLQQNTNPDISEISIKNDMASILITLNKHDEAIKLYKDNNVCGINNALIGYSLSLKAESSKEAFKYLSDAYIETLLNDLFRMMLGYANAYNYDHQLQKSVSALEWYITLLQNSRESAEITYLDKIEGLCLGSLVNYYIELNDLTKAKSALDRAIMLGKRFDENPRYTMDGILFFHGSDNHIAYDDFGDCFIDTLYQRILSDDKTKDKAIQLWEELIHESK